MYYSYILKACQLRRNEDVDERIVAVLLAKGADVNQKCNFGKTPLELAGGNETRVGRLLGLYTERYSYLGKVGARQSGVTSLMLGQGQGPLVGGGKLSVSQEVLILETR